MKALDPNTPAIVREADSLGELAAQINGAHANGMEATRKGLTFFRQVGEMLHRAKQKVPHGKWLDWLRENVRFSPQSASNYMRIATNWESLSGDSGLQEALHILAGDAAEETILPTIGNSEPEQSVSQEEVEPDEGDDRVAAGDEDNPRVPGPPTPPMVSTKEEEKDLPREFDWPEWESRHGQLMRSHDILAEMEGKNSDECREADGILETYYGHMLMWRAKLDVRRKTPRRPSG